MKCSALSLSIVLATIAGCTIIPPIIPPLDPRAALKGELDANRAKWIAAGIQTYQVRYAHFCFCPPETVRSKHINVENGVVVSAIYVDDGNPVTLDQYADVPTINGLFDQIQEILNAPAFSYEGYALIFEYDGVLGYPKLIKLVAPVNVADGGSTQTAELLPPTDSQEKLELNRAKWNAAGMQTYQFRYSQFCFCPTDTVRQKDIIVENGEVAFAKYVDTGERVPDEQFAHLPTINDLFDQIQTILDAPPSTYEGYSLNFEYDEALGYEISCFCQGDAHRPKDIFVMNHVVVSAKYLDDGSPVPPDQLVNLPTFNDLFDRIQILLDNDYGHILTVEYDAEQGYPRSIVRAEILADYGSVQTATRLPDGSHGPDHWPDEP